MMIRACMYIKNAQDFVKALCYTNFLLPIFVMMDTTSIYVTSMFVVRILFGLSLIFTDVLILAATTFRNLQYVT